MVKTDAVRHLVSSFLEFLHVLMCQIDNYKFKIKIAALKPELKPYFQIVYWIKTGFRRKLTAKHGGI